MQFFLAKICLIERGKISWKLTSASNQCNTIVCVTSVKSFIKKPLITEAYLYSLHNYIKVSVKTVYRHHKVYQSSHYPMLVLQVPVPVLQKIDSFVVADCLTHFSCRLNQ